MSNHLISATFGAKPQKGSIGDLGMPWRPTTTNVMADDRMRRYFARCQATLRVSALEARGWYDFFVDAIANQGFWVDRESDNWSDILEHFEDLLIDEDTFNQYLEIAIKTKIVIEVTIEGKDVITTPELHDRGPRVRENRIKDNTRKAAYRAGSKVRSDNTDVQPDDCDVQPDYTDVSISNSPSLSESINNNSGENNNKRTANVYTLPATGTDGEVDAVDFFGLDNGGPDNLTCDEVF